MFYLYRDGQSFMARIREVLPFESLHSERMINEARDLIFASVVSSLVAAAAHGILGGFAFGLAGITAPVFWGVMMGFFSLVPLVGSALIWVPAAISLIANGHLTAGILVAVFCSIVVGLVDNLLRPWVISGRAEMGGLVVFISVLGGISVFGLLGVVVGPIIVATGASLLDLYAPGSPAGNIGVRTHGKKKPRRARVAPFGHTHEQEFQTKNRGSKKRAQNTSRQNILGQSTQHLPPEKLCWRCDPAHIPFETTAEVPALFRRSRARNAHCAHCAWAWSSPPPATTFSSADFPAPAAAA